MTLSKVADVAALVLAVVYALACVGETVRATVSGDGHLLFWTGTLGGGAALILAGHVLRHRPAVCAWLVAGGAFLGAPATAWTLVVPVLALAVVVLAVLRAGTEIDRLQGAG